ncbi:MAG: hypothetical protein M3016_08550 [Actinomycetota bacterium]|nr:hypothetical protein [Actinomycetota bacterium]
MVGVAALSVAACGSVGGKAATDLRAPTPINLTVYVNDSRVSVSPSSVGAGPVVFIVTNQASGAEALAISRAGDGHPLASTAPINPQGTTQVSVNFRPGEYTIATAGSGATDAQQSFPSSIRAASIHIGHQRKDSSSTLLQP